MLRRSCRNWLRGTQLVRDLLFLAIHLIVAVAKFLHPGGARSVAAESLLLKQQLRRFLQDRPPGPPQDAQLVRVM
jgi:hypothetical protein